MHILVTNDDGPPSAQASPYLLPFVQALEANNHTVSVIVPDAQRSWIGKAHIVGQEVRTAPYWPPTSTPPTHDTTSGSQPDGKAPWMLVDSTPATCTQLGLSHFFTSRGPIDLVVSGPNYGRNTTAIFALSSGTLGAAMEAAVCGYRAIAISFAFFDRNNDVDVVAESCTQAVRVIEYLAREGRWGEGRLFSVNVPVLKGVAGKKVRWTRMLQNQWKKGACFQELGAQEHPGSAGAEEVGIRRRESQPGVEGGGDGAGGEVREEEWRGRSFKWAPRFTDVYEAVEAAGPGSDGWTVKQGETSVTALRANFMHVDGVEGGEVKL